MKIIVAVFTLVLPFAAMPITAQENASAVWNFNTGRNLEALGRMDEANVYYNDAVRIALGEISRNAVNEDSYAALTWTLQRQRRYAEVITWGERALALFANDYRIVQTMGEAYFYLNNHDASLRFMRRYVNAMPRGGRTSVAYFFIGEIYRLRSNFRLADVAYSTAVNIEPGIALWWFRTAAVREATGYFPEAIEAYERALALNPSHEGAREGLARSRGAADL